MKNPFKVLVTSQKGGVGKSTISANLAAYWRCSGARVTLLDFDTHGSSSSWLRGSPNLGVDVQHQILPLNQGSNRPFMEARRHLNRAANASDIVICDLTWTDCIASDLMFEYDLVIVPSSVSDIELAATAEFLNRHSWIFNSSDSNAPILLLVPTRVHFSQLSGDVFSKQRFPISFMLAPPILESQSARDMFQCGYLKDLKDACGESFNEFCRTVRSLRNMTQLNADSFDSAIRSLESQSTLNLLSMQHNWRNNAIVARRKLSSQYSILERYRLDKTREDKLTKESLRINDLMASRSSSDSAADFIIQKLPKFLKSF